MANAWRYADAGCHINMSAFEPPLIPQNCQLWIRSHFTKQEGVYMIVQNGGKGISSEQCQQLFEPLYQLDQARSQKRPAWSWLRLEYSETNHGEA